MQFFEYLMLTMACDTLEIYLEYQRNTKMFHFQVMAGFSSGQYLSYILKDKENSLKRKSVLSRRHRLVREHKVYEKKSALFGEK